MTSPLPHPSLIGDIDAAIAGLLADHDEAAKYQPTIDIASTSIPGLNPAAPCQAVSVEYAPERRGWRRWVPAGRG
jgi:hypothetical protein